jgi:hypothetical protein
MSIAFNKDFAQAHTFVYLHKSTLKRLCILYITRLHTLVVDIIEKYREKEGEPPATMLAVYEYLHRKHIDKVADIKRYKDMYKQTDI